MGQGWWHFYWVLWSSFFVTLVAKKIDFESLKELFWSAHKAFLKKHRRLAEKMIENG